MTVTIKFRLISFALAIALLAGLIAWAAFTTWQDVRRLEAFDSSKIASYEIADHLQNTILRLNNILGDYALNTNEQASEKFDRESKALNEWIDAQKVPGKTSLAESNLLDQIDAGYDGYLGIATNVIQQLQGNRASEEGWRPCRK